MCTSTLANNVDIFPIPCKQLPGPSFKKRQCMQEISISEWAQSTTSFYRDSIGNYRLRIRGSNCCLASSGGSPASSGGSPSSDAVAMVAQISSLRGKAISLCRDLECYEANESSAINKKQGWKNCHRGFNIFYRVVMKLIVTTIYKKKRHFNIRESKGRICS